MRKDWEYKKLGEICDIYQPKTISNEMLVKEGKYPVYGANGTIGFYNSYNHIESEILLTCRGATCGTINVSQPYSWINGNAMVIHRKSDYLDFKFLYFLMTALDYSPVINGAAQPQITRARIAPVKVAIPPKSTQLSIVSELDKINELIRIKKEQLKDYDALAQSIFYEMFGEPVKNEKGWEVKKIGDVCKTSSGGTPSKAHNEYYNGDILWLRSGEVSQGDIYDTEQTITLLGLENSSAKIFPVNTVVIAMYGATVGQVGVLRKEMSTNQAICGILPNGVLTPEYLNYFLLSRKFEFLKSAIGGAQANISQQIIRKTLIPLPPLSLQNSFTCRIRRIKQLKIEIQKTITDMEILLASRMQYWFG